MAEQKVKEPVAGFKYSTSDGSELDGMICQIIARAGDDHDNLGEPHFLVEFGDGTQMVALSSELNPWFPT